MATFATPARQPFGVLSDSKIRTLQSLKNRQNAIPPTSTPLLKKRALSPELSDSENIDPNVFKSPTKRKRVYVEDDVSLAKSLRAITHVTSVNTKPDILSSNVVPTVTPRPDALVRPARKTPLSAPAAAGRSPTRSIGKPALRRRFAPPMVRGVTSPGLSLSAALRGTLAHKKTRPAAKRAATLEETKPSSWVFDIFEETEEQQDYRIGEWTMTQSSAALDISDDKGRCLSLQVQNDQHLDADEGKENIDPNEMLNTNALVNNTDVTVVSNEGAKHITPERSRTPLGDLKAGDFYAEGLSATSVVLVQDDSTVEAPADATPQPVSVQDFTFDAPLTAQNTPADEVVEEIPEWAWYSSTVSAPESTQKFQLNLDRPRESTDIEIWESESAKDENESGERENTSSSIVVEAGETICISAFVLQEL